MFHRLSLLWRRFTPIEESILAEVEHVLPAACREKFVKQRRAINKVQRILDWTEINFYSMRDGTVNWEPSIAFRNRGEVELAEVRFSIGRRDFHSTIWAISGHVFSLVTRPSIKPYAFQKITAIRKVALLSNPEDAPGDATMWRTVPSARHMAWIHEMNTAWSMRYFAVLVWAILLIPIVVYAAATMTAVAAEA
jgi:hypothetical protein